MPSSILCDRFTAWNLTWSEIEDYMLTSEEKRLLKGDLTLEDIDYELRRSRESELLRYRSRSGLLDINRIDRRLFEQQFRFQKDDIDGLVEALLIPEVVVSAHKVNVPGRDARCLALRHLAYPNKWCHLQSIFGLRYSVMSSVTSKVLKHIVGTFGHLLNDCNNHTWLSPSALAYVSTLCYFTCKLLLS
ncbi:hypothetical protein HPB48_023525 [Haemaphysalis longicornis]|uniref:Uncharacterized protein n=1 Tax=Haemaphysalis longicornis TaxID=44386 RepID=A0A9J6GWP5_HAELO|nr:hypothetical protein HPB48_023525 [Haemaphysalis longicornis]